MVEDWTGHGSGLTRDKNRPHSRTGRPVLLKSLASPTAHWSTRAGYDRHHHGPSSPTTWLSGTYYLIARGTRTPYDVCVSRIPWRSNVNPDDPQRDRQQTITRQVSRFGLGNDSHRHDRAPKPDLTVTSVTPPDGRRWEGPSITINWIVNNKGKGPGQRLLDRLRFWLTDGPLTVVPDKNNSLRLGRVGTHDRRGSTPRPNNARHG